MHDIKGIKGRYPYIPLPVKLKAIVQLVRPFTLLTAFIAGFFTYLFAVNYLNQPHIFGYGVLCGLTMALLQAGGQSFNQSVREEVEIDRANGKTYRPTVSGIISLTEAKITSLSLIIAGLIISYIISFKFFIACIFIAFFAIFYTAPPLRVKRFFFANNLWQAVARGYLPFIAVFSIYYIPNEILLYAIIVMIYVIGAQTTKDFNDVEGDRKFGIRTVPVVLGFEKAVGFMMAFIVIAFIIFNVSLSIGLIDRFFIVSYIPFFISIPMITSITKSLKFTENNISWVLYYISLGLFYLLPSITIMIWR